MNKEIITVECSECGYIGPMECTVRMGSKKRVCKCPDCENKPIL